ncbi:MAG TPA: hypothetical protein VHA06_08070 [Candidatus Angelobacter sp.]|nr:hypothetical protein [Candidatus Angelobacter sp.]
MPEIPDFKTERANERKNVLKALKTAGFNARVKHGRGTAHAWLDVTIIGSVLPGATTEVRRIAEQASGRSASAAEHISINFDSIY